MPIILPKSVRWLSAPVSISGECQLPSPPASPTSSASSSISLTTPEILFFDIYISAPTISCIQKFIIGNVEVDFARAINAKSTIAVERRGYGSDVASDWLRAMVTPQKKAICVGCMRLELQDDHERDVLLSDIGAGMEVETWKKLGWGNVIEVEFRERSTALLGECYVESFERRLAKGCKSSKTKASVVVEVLGAMFWEGGTELDLEQEASKMSGRNSDADVGTD